MTERERNSGKIAPRGRLSGDREPSPSRRAYTAARKEAAPLVYLRCVRLFRERERERGWIKEFTVRWLARSGGFRFESLERSGIGLCFASGIL